MKRLSEATATDFDALLESTRQLDRFDVVEDAAQALVDMVYERFRESLTLLRLFTSLPYRELPLQDRQLVDAKASASAVGRPPTDTTPVLTLLGTRGQDRDWNARWLSKGFRCIPLLSSEYVASLPMLAMQLRSMHLDFGLFDAWESTVVAEGRADGYGGTLFVSDASIDQDEQGRMIVPHQDFVAENGVKSVLGIGSGYANHPTLVTLFAFTNEVLDRSRMEPFEEILEAYVSASAPALAAGRIFRSEK